MFRKSDNLESLSLPQQQYVEVLRDLIKEAGHARMTDVADRLGVSLPSASEGVKRLEKLGLVVRKSRFEILLSTEGQRVAALLQERHQALRRFMVDVMAMNPNWADDLACRVEHCVDKKFAERLVALAEFLETEYPWTLKGIRNYIAKQNMNNSLEIPNKNNDQKLEPLFARLASDAWMAALELGVPQLLYRKPASAQEVAANLNCDGRAMRMLLDALVGQQYLEKEKNRYLLPASLKRLIELPGIEPETFFADELEHMRHLAEDWDRLAEVIASGRSLSSAGDENDDGAHFVHLARHLFPKNYLAGREIFSSLPERFRTVPLRVLDVGAGSAAWSIPFAEAHGGTTVVASDFDAVLPIVQHFTTACGVENQYTLKAGNIHDVEYAPENYDVVILGHVCHSEGAEGTRELFRRMHAALDASGIMLVVDFVPDDERQGEANGDMPLLFALNMLVHTNEGGTFTLPEYASWAKEAGFISCDQIALPSPATVLMFAKDQFGEDSTCL